MLDPSASLAPPVPHSHDHVIRLEVATEILNGARGKLFERIYQIENEDPQDAARLSAQALKLREVYQQLVFSCNGLVFRQIKIPQS